MGLFNKNPYTKDQQESLRISKQIKQGRADRLVAADKAKAKEAAKQARLARMGELKLPKASSLKLPPAPKLPDTSKQQVQRMKGKQAMDLAKFKATEKSLADKRAETRAQLGAESARKTVPPPKVEAGNWGIEKDDQFNEYLLDKKTGKTKALTLPGAKPVAAQGPAPGPAPGGNKYEALPPTISTVLDMERNNPEELRAYMDWMKKNKPKEFLKAAEGYRKFHNPAPADEDTTQQIQPGADIYQNSSGKYTNM